MTTKEHGRLISEGKRAAASRRRRSEASKAAWRRRKTGSVKEYESRPLLEAALTPNTAPLKNLGVTSSTTRVETAWQLLQDIQDAVSKLQAMLGW